MADKNNYEGLFIVRPDLGEEDVKAVFKEIVNSVTANKGSITKEEEWGKRALAFPVEKCSEGFYYKVNFEAPAGCITKLNGTYKLNSRILRVMITRR
ncbi:30S ribosomal protein S6 [Candidatus Omnitrophota bacterium]